MNNKFGPHLMLDCSDCDKDKLRDLELVYQVLNTLPDVLRMTKIIPPYVFPYSGKVPEDKGITGVVIIAESHLTIHTFSEKGYMFCDIFSCVPFDVDVATQYIVDAFDVKSHQKYIIERGANYPRGRINRYGRV